MKRIAFKNVFASVLLQIVTIIYGFFIPKMVLRYFGSEVNGLVSSITQLLSYISLVEGGITAVIIAKLYDPLVKNNYSEVSSIVFTGTKFFKKIGILFFIYSLVLALICPFYYSTKGFSYVYICVLTIILSISLLIQYMMSLGLKCLLNADKKVYFISIVQIIILVFSFVLSYISIRIYPSIHVFKFINGICYIIQPMMYHYYIKKHYTLDNKAKENKMLIKDRWNGFANNVAYFIHTSTDITILTFFTDLTVVSVYSVYSLVTSGLKALIGSINNGLFSSVGHLYAKRDFTELERKFDIYEFAYLIIVFLTFTIASLLITPFVKLYVGQVDSANTYYQPLFRLFDFNCCYVRFAKSSTC